MKFTPHSYQKYSIQFILEHPVSALLLDCGLGKTVITLTAIDKLMHETFEVSKVLIIAPLRVARTTWADEIKKWDHLQGLTYSIAVGTEKERISALNEHADVYIINRENIPWLIDESGLPFDYDMLVIDELSSFKNYKAKRFKALMKVRPKVKRVVGLTGTPSSNGLMDLFAEYKILDMGARLGRFIGQYRNNYFMPDKRNGQIVYSYKPLPGAEEKIYDRISDITISMRAAEHLKMPELIETEYTVRMDEKEQEHYNEMKRSLVLSLGDDEITAANAASLSNKLTQMANGAVYDDCGKVLSFHDRKLDALEDIIESMNGRPLLVAYWYKHDLTRIEQRLRERGITYERLNNADSIQRLNDQKIPVALIHPASAGHGLNLQQGGSTLVWFGLTWSLELYSQTNARLYRQGQKNTVVIQHIVMENTIDERILRALKAKEQTQTALLDAVKKEMQYGI